MTDSTFKISLAVFIGGFAGTFLRFTINEMTSGAVFPLGTVIENISGSFLLGLLTGWVLIRYVSPVLKEGLGAGFCGGFTTMSTFMADVSLLGQASEQAVILVSLYVFVSLTGGMAAAWLGIHLGQKAAGGDAR